MNDWDKILDDFARKCKGGAPDMTNPRHLALLRESLIKFGWKENATNEFIGNLREGEDIKIVKADTVAQAKALAKKGQYWSGNHKGAKVYGPKGGKKDDKEDGKEKKKKRDPSIAPDIPKKQKLSDKERKARLEQDTKDINFDEEGKPRTPEERRKRAKEKAERRRKEIYWGKDFPAGNAGSTTGEMGGGMAAEDIGDPDNPNISEEDWIDRELDAINEAHDEVEGKGSLRKKICDKKKAEACDKAIKEWLKVAYNTGLNELNQIKNNKDYKARKPQPPGLPSGHIMDYHGKEMVVNEMEQQRSECTTQECKDHYDQQLRYLGVPPGNPDERSETDTGVMYMDKEGRLKFKHTSNKKSESDPHFNKSILSRQVSMNESADRELKRCEKLVNPDEAERCRGQVETARSDIKTITDTANGDVRRGDRVAGSDVRDITGREGGKEDLMKGSSLFNKLPGRSELQGSDYSDKVRKKDSGYGAIYNQCEKTFGKQPPKWTDDQIMEANVFLLENGEPTTATDAKQMEGKEEGKVVLLENGKYARIVNGEPRYCDVDGNPEFGPGTSKLLYKMSEMIDTMRTKNSKRKPPLTQESSDKELKELGAEYKPPLSADEMRWILFSESATGLRDTNDKRKAAMDKAHAKIVRGVQDSDAKLEGFEPKPPPDGNVTDKNGDNGPATQQYVDSYMEDMHWNRYIDGDNDGVGDMSINGKNVQPKHFRECLAEKSGFDKKLSKDLESKDPKKREAAREALKEHLRKKLRISAKTEGSETDRVTKESKEAHISFDSETDEVLRGKKTGRKRKVSVGEETYRSKGVGVNSVLGGLGADMQTCIVEKMDRDNK